MEILLGCILVTVLVMLFVMTAILAIVELKDLFFKKHNSNPVVVFTEEDLIDEVNGDVILPQELAAPVLRSSKCKGDLL